MSESLIGRVGQATSPLSPGVRGEVLLCDDGDGTTTYLAYSEEMIPKGARVHVVDELPGRTVYVSTERAFTRTLPQDAPVPGSSIMPKH